MTGYARNHPLLIIGALLLSTLVTLSEFVRSAVAQAYPTRPTRLIVGFPPGTSADILARIMGRWLSERLGQPFVVENRPGAAGNLATESVVRASPDGYTLLLVTPPNTINATLYDELKFDFLRDIAPVSGIVQAPLVIGASLHFPVRTIPELIAFAKANPAKVSVASAGNGSVSHLTIELLKMRAGIDVIRVPYASAASAFPDIFAGQVQMLVDPIVTSIEHIRAGRLRPMAITTATRSELLPDVPVIGEVLAGYEASAWAGIGAPKGTPAEIIDKLNRVINAALADPKIKARLADLGGTVFAGSADEFQMFVNRDVEKWASVIKFSGIKPN
jgi:tripartite-type tricarboxylate transporter receptor subunit TctC